MAYRRHFEQAHFITGAGRRPNIYHSRPPLSIAIKDHMPPGSVWYTDISLQRPPDHQGHRYSRLFAEEHFGYASTYYSANKDSDTLTLQLDAHATWVRQNVPGGCFLVLRCDFASEIVRQNHGGDYYTQAKSRYCDAHPGFRVLPCPPHSPALNRSEGTWGRIHGLAHINAQRARIGPLGWSIMERGAVFQHNHTPAPRARDHHLHDRIRSEALTLVPFDVSTMLGFVGQTGWIHRHDAKMNTYHPSAEPVLYICPSATTSAQQVFNLRSWKIQLVSDVTLSLDPRACGLLLARSVLYRPAGSLASPEASAYESRLTELLEWVPNPDTAVVTHNPVTGLPTSVQTYVPWLDPDGSLLMLPPDDAPDVPEQPDPDAPGSPGAPPDPTAPPHPTPIPWDTLSPTLDVGTALARLATEPDTSLTFKPDHAKKGLSAARWLSYSKAATYSEYMSLHKGLPGHGPRPLEELRHDLKHDLVRIGPPPTVVRAVTYTGPRPRTIETYVDEQATLRALLALDPTPPPGHPLLDSAPPDLIGTPRQHTHAYTTGPGNLSRDPRHPSHHGENYGI